MNEQENTKHGYKAYSGSSVDFVLDERNIYDEIYNDIDGPNEDDSIETYRKAALLYASQLRIVLGYLADRIDTFDIKAKILIYAVILALKCDDLINVKSQRVLAKSLNVNHGSISHHKVAIERELKKNIERMAD